MDDSKVRRNNDGIFKSPKKDSENFYINLMKCSLLLGAEKMLMARSSPAPLTFSNLDSCKNTKHFGEENYVDSHPFALQPQSNHYIELPLDSVSVLLLKLASFQIGLLATFFALPIQILNIWIAFLMFPFRAIAFGREILKQKVMNLWNYSCFSLIYFICDRIRMQKSVLKLAVRLCWAFFWAAYVFLVLLGMLMMGFIIGGIVMRKVAVEPIQTTENLNFDYTKPSPVSFVPTGLNSETGTSTRIPFSKNVGGRPIPYGHQLELTVSLTMPESDYNRNLGIFQVKVESLAEDGKVTSSSSYPSMQKFKSQQIRFISTMIRSIPLLTGFRAEVQNLEIKLEDFTEGLDPTSCFKVSIVQRAEYEPGHGVPEIYAASLHVESKLPKLKRMIWDWRRTLMVWVSFASFLAELVVVLLWCRPAILFPGRTVMKVVGDKGRRYRMNKISW